MERNLNAQIVDQFPRRRPQGTCWFMANDDDFSAWSNVGNVSPRRMEGRTYGGLNEISSTASFTRSATSRIPWKASGVHLAESAKRLRKANESPSRDGQLRGGSSEQGAYLERKLHEAW